MNPELIKRTQDFLFASEEEMVKAHVPSDVRRRLFRLRDMYSYWLRNPKLGDRHILAEIKRRNNLGDTQAYEDLRLLKLCLGNLQQMTRDWYQYLFIARCEEGFQMARDKGEAGAPETTWLERIGNLTFPFSNPFTNPDEISGHLWMVVECSVDGEVIYSDVPSNIAAVPNWEEILSGINTPAYSSNHNATLFDLHGRRLTTPPARGVFIHDGKKVIK